MPNAVINSGVISDPPPTPVSPTISPTPMPDNASHANSVIVTRPEMASRSPPAYRPVRARRGSSISRRSLASVAMSASAFATAA